jgi:Leucine-rich repeat (LRR) protein
MNLHLIGIVGEKSDFHIQINVKKMIKYLDEIVKIKFIPKYLHCKLDDEIIQYYPYLEYLRCINNRLTEKGIGTLSNLKILFVCGIQFTISRIVKKLSKLLSLTILNNFAISDNELKSLPNLKRLTICNRNSITDNGIKNLTNLEELYLSHNCRITDKGIKNLIHLKKLNLSNNDIITCEGK